MSDVAVGEMTIDDYDKVLGLWLGTERLGVSREFDSRERIAAYLDRNPGLSTVARENGVVVGAVLCGHDGRRGQLCHLAVAQQHRRRGIARRMVERSLECLKAAGIDSARVFVLSDSEGAAAFWRRMEWKKFPGVDYYYREFP